VLHVWHQAGGLVQHNLHFQVGGNTGTAIGPLLAALIIVPFGQHAVACLVVFALLAIWILTRVSQWTIRHAKTQAVSRIVNASSKLHGRQLTLGNWHDLRVDVC
jgi:FSR family fosmidomycin resistance protein-like MFS transporter